MTISEGWCIFTVYFSLHHTELQPTIILLRVDCLQADVADEFWHAAFTVTVGSKGTFFPSTRHWVLTVV